MPAARQAARRGTCADSVGPLRLGRTEFVSIRDTGAGEVVGHAMPAKKLCVRLVRDRRHPRPPRCIWSGYEDEGGSDGQPPRHNSPFMREVSAKPREGAN